MKKSLIVLAAFVMSLALVGIAFAEVECVFKPTKTVVAPKCMTVPAKTMVTKPGTAYAKYEKVEMVSVPVKWPVFMPTCQGKGKGGFAVGCNDKVTWTAKWMTAVQCGEWATTKKELRPVPKLQPLACKTVPVRPGACPW